MSVVPLYLRMLDDLTPANIFDQDFGLGLLNEDLFAPRQRILVRPSRQGYLRNWAQPGTSAVSNLTNNKDEFRVNLDVQQFKPEEVAVKVVDNFVVIDGKHEERQDEHGYIQRSFQRRYLLPEGVDPSTVTSQLSSDGVLSVHAPKKKGVAGNERPIPIVQTNAPAVKNEQPKKNDAKEDTMEQ